MRLLLPLVCLIAGCLAAVPPQALAQGTIRVDTIFKSIEPRIKPLNFLQVHGDTVVMIVGDLADPGGWLFRSLDRGDTWDSLRMTYPNEPQMPGNGLYIFGMVLSPTPIIFISRDGWTVTKDYPFDRGIPGTVNPRELYVHPLTPELTFLRTEFSGRFPNSDVHFLFWRRNDTTNWTEVPLPMHTLGSSRRIWLSFDFGRPERLWVTVNGEDWVHDDLEEEYYYSDDLGATWTQIPVSYPALIGLFRQDWGTDYDISSNAFFLRNAFTQARDTLPWSERIAGQIWRDADPGSIRVRASPGTAPKATSLTGFAVHPSDPGFICLAALADTLIAGTWQGRSSYVLTTDFGQTWYLLKVDQDSVYGDTLVSEEHNDPGAVVAPWNRQVFIPYVKEDGKPGALKDTIRESGLLRYTIMGGTAVDEGSPARTLELWPNPANTSLYMRLPQGLGSATLRIVDILGNDVTQSVLQQRGAEGVLIGTEQLAAGLYHIVLEHRTGIQSVAVMIIH